MAAISTWRKPPDRTSPVSVTMRAAAVPAWARWTASDAYSVGLEEEVMLLSPEEDWCLAQRLDEINPLLSAGLTDQISGETHDAVLELTTRPHASALSAADEAATLRERLSAELEPLGPRAASAGTHPCAIWSDTQIASGARHQDVYAAMRELARREPTFGLHVHVGVTDPESAITLHTACGPISRCCWPYRPTPPSGRAATADWPRRARRSSRPSPESGRPVRLTITRIMLRPSTACCDAAPSPTRPTCGGKFAPNPSSELSR